MDKLKRALGRGDDEEQGIMDEVDSSVSSLSWSTRIKGFVICFAIGCVMSVLGSIAVFMHNYVMFGLLYTLGSLISLTSTLFLMGPLKQLKKMFAPTRMIATGVALLSMALTLMAAFWWRSGILCLVFVAFQFLAMTWYSISYIPYARDAVMSCVKGCIS